MRQTSNKKQNSNNATKITNTAIICGSAIAKFDNGFAKKLTHYDRFVHFIRLNARAAWQSDILAKLKMKFFYTITIQPKQAFSVLWKMLVLQ